MLSGFPRVLLPTLACQKDGGALSAPTGNYITEAELVCERCGHSYPIREGIVYMLGALLPAEEREKDARDKEAEVYDTRLVSRHHKEVIPMLRRMRKGLRSARVIEYAAGTGRITIPVLERSRAVLAVDFSLDSLRVLARKAPPHSTLGLVHADAVSFHTQPHAFDVALSAQFIEHVLDRDKRNTFYSNVRDTLKQNGVLFLSAYHHDMRRRMRREKRTGAHESGVPFHYFDAGEIRRELSETFRSVFVVPFDITLPLETRLNLSPRASGTISALLEHVPILRNFGHLLFVEARV